MNFFHNMKVSVKLMGGFLILAGLIVFVSVFSYLGINRIRTDLENIHAFSLTSNQVLSEIQSASYKLRGDMYKYVIVVDERSRLKAELASSAEIIDQNINLIEQMYADSPETLAAAQQFKADWVNYSQKIQDLLRLADLLNNNTDILSLQAINWSDTETARVTQLNSTSRLVNLVKENTLRKQDAQNRAITNNIIGMSIFALLAIGLSLFVGLALSRSFIRILRSAIKLLHEIGQGHLSERLDVQREDEFGDLIKTMNQFADDLQHNVVGAMNRIAAGDLEFNVERRDEHDEIAPALHQTLQSLRGLKAETLKLSTAAADGQISIRADENQFQGGYQEIVRGFNNTLDLIAAPLRLMVEATNSLNATSAELLATTTQQAAGASEQSAAISQTTTTVDEVKAITEQATARMQEMASAAQRTVEVARSGQKAVQDSISSMNLIKTKVESISENLLALSEQTQQIGEIINTVGELASQSNMLALNASVEAARAGEQGKGFAVVAQEVRTLADQSRAATQQIKDILSEIQKATNTTVMATEEGTKGVEMGVITVAQASKAIEQLSQVINDSSKAAMQVSAGGQQQRTGVEQIAAAMTSINLATVQSLTSTRQAENSAHNLNELARRMAEVTQKYRI